MKHSAVVTGGASGIGLAIARRLLEDGWPVAIIDADDDALLAAEELLAEENAIFLQADVTDEDEISDCFDEVVDRLGLIGGLVSAASIMRHVSAEETSAELLREVLDVNLVGSFIAARAALERMGASLSIVTIGSISGQRASGGHLAYGASKAAVKLMSEVLALEYGGRGVRVNCVAPGPVEIDAQPGRYSAEERRAWTDAIPQARFGEPEEVAAAAAFLLSPESSYINGHTLAVDGGFLSAGILAGR
jgi:NAD(P)-dependent dehydrogenase (short-subunit alcohol dehydrogenase family)